MCNIKEVQDVLKTSMHTTPLELIKNLTLSLLHVWRTAKQFIDLKMNNAQAETVHRSLNFLFEQSPC